jgi:sulfur-oxidizing protein SoxY
MNRRPVLALLALGLLRPWSALAAAWNKDAFGAKTVPEALKSLGTPASAPSKDLIVEAPQIAENGMVVPIEVMSNIPGTRAISVLIEKNPSPLAGRFEFADGALPFVKVNVKMAETSDVRVIAEAGGKSYVATREIKVTIGGCGG